MPNMCKNRDVCFMMFNTFGGEKCFLDFGYNTKFEFEKLNSGMVRVSRKNITINITLNEFNKRFIEI